MSLHCNVPLLLPCPLCIIQARLAEFRRTLTCLCTNTPSQSPSTRPFTIPSSLARALALSTALPHAGDWLNRVPICFSGSPSSRPGEFRCCLRDWLGVPLHSTSYFCPECHSTADPYGDHQVSSVWGQWRQNSTSQCHP